MATKILMRRGVKANLPALDVGEYGVATDTNEVFLGTSAGNILLTMPSGSMVDYAGTTAPSGWLMCDGSAISRTTYANLFSAIGTSYGVGNGSSTFNLPDFRGRFARYNDDMGAAPAFIDKTSVNAGSFVVGRKYKITLVGTTNFTLIGASANTVGVVFTATGVGSGTGTADESRVHGTTQSDDFKSHSHSTDATKWWGTRWTSSFTSTAIGADVTVGHGSASVNNFGGTETRPVNLACYRIIKI